jgi:hypothetical protein
MHAAMLGPSSFEARAGARAPQDEEIRTPEKELLAFAVRDEKIRLSRGRAAR